MAEVESAHRERGSLSPVRWTLSRPPVASSSPPRLDAHQREVVAHDDGPLLVLAGPGTGKTTTLVEAVAARVARGLRPEQVLTLTFSRRAAGELRRRIGLRLGATTSEPLAWTFHGFCHHLLRSHGGPDLRLLSAAEADVMLRDLLAGELADGAPAGSLAWPPSLVAALPTAGFADQLQQLLSRVTELGLGPEALDDLGRRAARPEWQVAARVGEQLAEVTALRGVATHADLVLRAVELAEQPQVLRGLRQQYRAVLVDEYQDTDPLQQRLLRALAGDGGDLLVVGDPDQSIYAFRGARIDNILQFPDRFRRRDGAPARQLALRTCRRMGPSLLAPSRALMSTSTVLHGLSTTQVRRLRDLRADAPDGAVEVATFPTEGAQLDAVVDLLRRAHLDDGVPWSQMAVLVRSGARSLPTLRRVLGAAGVPVTVAGDELPLSQEPSVQPLLQAARTADLLRAGAPRSCAAETERAALTTAERLTTLLMSPLVGADAGDLRRLGRRLRQLDVADGARRMPRSSHELLRAAVLDPTRLVGVPRPVAAPVRRLTELLAAAGRALSAGEGAEQALWALWSDSGWAARAEATSGRAGASGRAADREIDAVLALFEAVARSTDRTGGTGVSQLLDQLAAQHIPAGPTAERAASPEAVRLLTAHRSKGLEWEVVAVVDVQEGSWPDLRQRGSLLGVESIDLDPAGRLTVVDPPDLAQRLAEERRLFYVALTRARRRLLVTAVDGADETADPPSRLLADLGVEVQQRARPAQRPLTLTALVGELRRVAVDPDEPEQVRLAACRRLARLARARDAGGEPLVSAADPAGWWGLASSTRADAPVRDPDAAVRLSGSAVQTYQRCPLAWFLGREVRAEKPVSARMGFGTVLHVLAEHLGHGALPAELPALAERLDQVWQSLAFDTPWHAEQERAQAHEALGRLLARLVGSERRLLGVEVPFDVTVGLPRGDDREPLLVRLTGAMDRVEVDAEGRIHVVDLKTGKSSVSQSKVDEHPQLGVYQLVAASPDLELPELPDASGPRVVGGAELWQLRQSAGKAAPGPKVQAQAPLPAAPAPRWIDDALREMAQGVADEHFPARPDDSCGGCDFQRVCPAWPEGEQVVR